MSKTIRWGIVGTGDIAKKFAAGLTVLPDSELVAVASRSRKTADAFGDLFHVTKRYDNYEGLTQDPDVNVVYIATPHSLHKENTVMCLQSRGAKKAWTAARDKKVAKAREKKKERKATLSTYH